jgi:hypothetical protein
VKLMRGILAGALALAVMAGLGACATRANYDEVVLYYKAGTGDNRHFQQCIPGGKSGPYPFDDETYSLPTTLRTWDIQADGSGDTKTPVDTGTKIGADGRPGPHVVTFATVKFFLNTNCGSNDKDAGSPAVRFFETLGARGWGGKNAKIFAEGGGFNADAWRALLSSTVVAAEQKALAAGTRLYLADDLEANAHGERSELERRITPVFQKELNTALGGDFFCGAAYRRNQQVDWTELVQTGVDTEGAPIVTERPGKGFCPPVQISITDINFADQGIADARAAVYKAEQEAKQKVIAAQAELDRSRILGEAAQNEAYLKYQQIQAELAMAEACKQNSSCTVIVDQSGRAATQIQQQVK